MYIQNEMYFSNPRANCHYALKLMYSMIVTYIQVLVALQVGSELSLIISYSTPDTNYQTGKEIPPPQHTHTHTVTHSWTHE